MAQRIPCPLPEHDDTDRAGNPMYYVEVPDAREWTGEHAQRRDSVIESTAESGLGDTLRNFMIALALCDSWHLPGLSMQDVEDGNVQPVSLEIIAWVNAAVLSRYRRAVTVPKDGFVPLSVLERIATAQRSQESTAGDSDEEE